MKPSEIIKTVFEDVDKDWEKFLSGEIAIVTRPIFFNFGHVQGLYRFLVFMEGKELVFIDTGDWIMAYSIADFDPKEAFFRYFMQAKRIVRMNVANFLHTKAESEEFPKYQMIGDSIVHEDMSPVPHLIPHRIILSRYRDLF